MSHRLLIGVSLGLFVLAPAGTAGPRSEFGRLVLKRLDEVRQRTYVAEEDAFALTKPGLALTFGIELPDGRRVVEVGEPESLTAVDSTGRDLAEIEANFFGRQQHVELVQVWGEAPSEFKFRLALPRRNAKWFDLNTTVDVLTDRGTWEAVIDLGPEWTTLEPKLFPGERVAARLRATERDVQLELRPGTVRSTIESAHAIGAGEALEPYSSMWNDAGLTYYFERLPAPDARVKLTLRKGLRQMPMTIDVVGQPLP